MGESPVFFRTEMGADRVSMRRAALMVATRARGTSRPSGAGLSASSGSRCKLSISICLFLRAPSSLSFFFRYSARLPFSRTRHIKNQFNSGKEVKISRDGMTCSLVVVHQLQAD